MSAEFAHQSGGGRGGAAGSQQVVTDENFLAGLHGVLMDFESVGAVLELVRDARRFRRQLFRFSHGDKTRAEPVRQRGSKNESARFHTDHQVHGLAGVVAAKLIHERAKTGGILQQRGQIVEKNSRLRVIRNFSNQFFQIVHAVRSDCFAVLFAA